MVPWKQQLLVLILKGWKGRGRSQGAELGPTELPSSLDVDVVVAAAYSDDDPQGLELLQVLPGQGDGVVHHGPHGFIQHLENNTGAWHIWGALGKLRNQEYDTVS